VFLDSISNRTKSKRKSIQTKRDKGKPFFNQYRRKNTNQGQNKRLKQKTIKKTQKIVHDKQKYNQTLSKRSSLLEKKKHHQPSEFPAFKKMDTRRAERSASSLTERRCEVFSWGNPMNLNPAIYEWSVIPPYHV